MKPCIAPLATGLALILASASARAEFEAWNTKVGTPAKMEMIGLDEGPDGAKVHFRTKEGGDITVKLEHLLADGQARAKEWKGEKMRRAEKAEAPVEAPFGYATRWPATEGGTQQLEFVFDLKSDCALFTELKISNPTVSVAGEKLEVIRWSGLVYDGRFEFEPMKESPRDTPGKWSIIISAIGNFPKVDPASCEFSADIEVMCGKSPKEITTTMPLPNDPADHIEAKEVGPFSIGIVRTSYPARGKKEQEPMATSYFLAVRPGDKKIDPGDMSARAAFSEAFLANGKEYPRWLYKEQATDPAKVVVRYWSESYKVPLHLSKAASNKGRIPPRKGLIDGMPRERSGD